MSVTLNAKGTSVPFFTIGKGGTTLYQGSVDPSISYTIHAGDVWVDTNTKSLNIRSAGAWIPPALGDLTFPTGTGTNGQVLVTDGAGNLSFSNAGSGSVTTVSVSSTNGFAGSVATATTTPVITLSTTITGILKGNGTALSAASAGDFPTLNQNTTGSAATLTTSRSITASGDADWTVNFDGSANATAALTLATVNSSPQTDTFRKVTVNGKGLVTATSAVGSSDITTALGYTPVNKAGDTMSGYLILNADPTAALGAVTKQYADNIAAGVNIHYACITATTAALPACTYDNGVFGVGATLTANANGAIGTVGGYASLTTSDRVLVKNQSSGLQNGIYVVTQVGSGGTPWILTRSSDFDGAPAAEIVAGDATYIQLGTLAGTQWVLVTTGTITVGTTSLSFSQFTGPGTYTGGTGIDITGTTISNTGVTSIAGTTNQITASASTGAVTLSLPSSVTIGGTMTAGTFSGSLSGNASTATALQTARTINGTSFDGTANITVTAAAGTLTGTTLNSSVVSSSLTSLGTIATGVWNGTTIGAPYGGTGQSSYTIGDILYASATNALTKLGIGSSNQVLTVVGGVPTWQPVTATAAGSTTQIQYNNAGATGASANLTWDNTNAVIYAGGAQTGTNSGDGGNRHSFFGSSASTTGANFGTASITVGNSNTTSNNYSGINFATLTGANTTYFSSGYISVKHGTRVNGQYTPSGVLEFGVTPATANTAPSTVASLSSTAFTLASGVASTFNSSITQSSGSLILNGGTSASISAPAVQLANNKFITLQGAGAHPGTDSFIWSDTSNSLILGTGNAVRFSILSNGAWSIGSTQPGTQTGTSGQVILSSGSGSSPSWGTVPNSGLTNSSITIGTTTVALGATSLTLAGVTDLTTTGNTILGNAVGDTLNVANGSLQVDASGNVGIGTTPSGIRLNVASGTTIWSQFGASTAGASYGQYLRGGTSTIGGYIGFDGGALLGSGTGTGFTLRSEADLIFMASAAEKVRIASAGNVTIQPPSSGYPLTATAAGTLSASFLNNTGGAVLAGVSFGSPGSSNLSAGVAGLAQSGTSGALILQYVTGGALTEGARIDTAGNFGIGASPTFKLDVSTNANSNAVVRNVNTATGGAAHASLRVETAATGGNPYTYYIRTGTYDWYTGIDAADNFFKIGTGSTVGASPTLTLASTSMGINTSPATTLHVKSSSVEAVRVETTIARGSGQVTIQLRDPTGTKGYFGYGSANDKLQIANQVNESIDFYTNATQRMTITGAGVIQDAAGNELGYRGMPAASVTTGTPVVADRGKCVYATGGVTIPQNVYSQGDVLTILNTTAGNITITQGTGVTMNLVGTATTGNRTLAQKGIATVICYGSNTFIITGGGLT